MGGCLSLCLRFRYKDQIKLDVEGFTDIRGSRSDIGSLATHSSHAGLAIAGGAFLVAQAAFVVLMATAKSPSYFIVDAEDGTLFLKKLDHYVRKGRPAHAQGLICLQVQYER
jgi:hypothetical protein